MHKLFPIGYTSFLFMYIKFKIIGVSIFNRKLQTISKNKFDSRSKCRERYHANLNLKDLAFPHIETDVFDRYVGCSLHITKVKLASRKHYNVIFFILV